MENYKKQDMEAIIAYMKGKEAVEVEDIIENAGAEPLRVYSILFELEQAGKIEVLETESFGSSKVVRLV